MKKLLLILMIVSAVSGFEAFDNFNRPNEQTLDTGNWFRPFTGVKITIKDSAIISGSAATLSAHWNTNFGSNQFSQITLTRFNGGAVNLYLCAGTDMSHKYTLKAYKDSLVLLKNTASLVNYPITINSGDTIRFSIYNDSMYAHVNNVERIKFFDSTYRGGFVGISFDPYNNATYNIADDFIGGKYSPYDFDSTAGTPAVITQQPRDTTINDLDSALFRITATGNNLLYQWYIDTSAISGATDSVFKFLATTKLRKKKIYCELTTDTTISSDSAVLDVIQIPPNHTGWPLELLSWNVNKAYPGIEYNYRLGIKGGEYPYRFALRHGPSGMVVDSITGEIKWTPDTASVS